MVIPSFSMTRTPELIVGKHALNHLFSHPLLEDKKVILLVTGKQSLSSNGFYQAVWDQFLKSGKQVHPLVVDREPTPTMIDEGASLAREQAVDAVVAIGGGSVLDTGKALSAMIPLEGSVIDYLESVGSQKHPGIKIPFIAVPTTSGTGSEATANAVLSEVGPLGYKRSLRHPSLVPDLAILDPVLSASCPASVTAASGLDALTQLVEAYVSTRANPMTDTLALQGIRAIGKSLLPVCTNASEDLDLRLNMSYGAYLSGVVLANAGLGLVHGFASTLGGYFDIPHGVVCGTLQGETVRMNIELLRNNPEVNSEGLIRYAEASRALTGFHRDSDSQACNRLIETLTLWIDQLSIPKLSHYGITLNDLDRLAKESDNKNNPTLVPVEHRLTILKTRL